MLKVILLTKWDCHDPPSDPHSAHSFDRGDGSSDESSYHTNRGLPLRRQPFF